MPRPREHGAILSGGVQVASTLKCPHCGMHFDPLDTDPAGQILERGFCEYCMAVTCGKEVCYPCVPEEAMLEAIERAVNAKSEFWAHMNRLK